MATKELSIILRASDQLSAPTRSAANAVAAALGTINHSADLAREALSKLTEPIHKLAEGLKEKFWEVLLAPGDSFIAEGIKRAIEGSVKDVAGVGSITRRLGLATDLVGELGHAARMKGQDINAIADALGVLDRNLVQFTLLGTGRGKEAFELLAREGLDLRGNFEGLGAILPKIADAFAQMSPERQQFFAKAFGGDPGLAAILRGGGGALAEAGAEGRRLGVVFSEEQIEKAHEFELATRRVSEAMLGIKAAIAEQAEPVVTAFLNRFAAELAELPRQAANLAHMFRDLVGDESDRVNAEQHFTEVTKAFVDLVQVGLVEGGKMAAAVFTEGIDIGIAALGPTIRDLFQEYVELPFDRLFHIDPEYSPAAQIAAYKKQLADLEKAANDAQRAIDSGAGEGGILSSSIFATKKADYQKIIDDSESQIRITKANLLLEQDAVKTQHAAEIKELTAQLRTSFSFLTKQSEESGAVLAKKWQTLKDAVATAGEYGPPSPFVDRKQELAEMKARMDMLRAREEGEMAVDEEAKEAIRLLQEQEAVYQRLTRAAEAYRLEVLAANDPRAAERQKLVDRIAQDRGEFLGPDGKGLSILGQQAPGEIAALQQAGDAVLHMFDGMTKLSAIEKESADGNETYRQTLERVSQELQAGQIQRFQAARMNQQAADAVRSLEQAERDRLEVLKNEFPELSTRIDDTEKRVTALIAKIGLGSVARPDTFFSGMKLGLRDFQNKLDDVGETGKSAFLTIADSAQSHLADALFAAGTNFRNLGQVARQALQGIVADIGHVASQLAAQEIFRGLFSAFGGSVGGGGGGIAAFLAPRAAGGPVAAGGMYLVGEEGPEVLAMGRGGGGFVYSGRGRGGASGWGAGGGGGGATIVVQQTNTFNAGITPEHAEAVKQASINGVVEALERNPTYLGRHKRATS